MAGRVPYFQNHMVFLNTLQLIKPHSLEETVQTFWQVIVGDWFRYDQGYKLGIKGPTLANRNMPDVTVIEVMALQANPRSTPDWAERQILMVECKRPSYDTPNGWSDTIEGQFFDDLQQNLNHSEKLFGAVAIGTKVKFFRFDGKAPVHRRLTPLHRDVLDLKIPSQLVQVEDLLNYIRANGWQWASTR
ncbi:hypothetical protein BO83DRAFT_381842 [Aspergillus eucalypticola CBS 122712]|uniref:Uncharacterized protein n=1 Tax=Aspergillus eucalypticola (strain CBS 122712 / IBT 29274) TaxID=1448314 RepID=A0A317URM3_ASPEC|nr:uncharacterized protein BO83DRAFT_381842 [Aspergillus eucalypticola CBS 122712]PWY64614.1 hypothetical protein BO83DRAFT_381842 [Aspergillus eucalypticola CBS 122712]